MKRQAYAFIIIAVLVMAVAAPMVSAADWKDTTIRNLTLQNWKDMVSNSTAIRNSTAVMANATALPLYNLTASWSRITVSGTQSMNFTTPRAGVYLVTATLNENVTLATATPGIFSQYALCDANNTVPVTNSERMGIRLTDIGNVTSLGRSYIWIYTNSTGASDVGLCGRLSSTPNGRWAIVSDSSGRSTVSYVRLP